MNDDALVAELLKLRRQSEMIIAAYEAMKPKERRAAALAIWRCRQRGCTLQFVWRSPLGTLFYKPGYKSSPRMNEEWSNEAGRAKNTFDGRNHWKPQAGSLDALLEHAEGCVYLECSHIPRISLQVSEMASVIDAATPGSPQVIIV